MGPLFIQTNREGKHSVFTVWSFIAVSKSYYRMTLSKGRLRRSEYVNGTKLAHFYLNTTEKQYKRKCIEGYVMCFLKTSAFDMKPSFRGNTKTFFGCGGIMSKDVYSQMKCLTSTKFIMLFADEILKWNQFTGKLLSTERFC